MTTPHTTAIRQAVLQISPLVRSFNVSDEDWLSEATAIIHRHLAPLLEQAEKGRGEALSSLQWIADQPCEQRAEGSSEDFSCTETGACATEWCLPCYARSALGEGPHACPRCDEYEKAQSLMDEAEWEALKALRAAGSDSLVAVALPLADGIKALAKERDRALARAAAAEGERDEAARLSHQYRNERDKAVKQRDESVRCYMIEAARNDQALAKLAACEAEAKSLREQLAEKGNQ